MLAEHPDGDLPLPETVQGLIAARIDGLAPEEKAQLQDASVIGKVFWPGALADASERILHALERKEFVRRDRRSSIAGETQYAFLHALVRDVAYGQIPRAERGEKHRRAAEWLGSLAGDRSEDHAEMLAHHYREALALAGAAGVDASDLREPARKAFTDAAERAYALNAYTAAIELGNEALALTSEDARERPALQLLVAYATWPIGDDDPEFVASARDSFLAHGDLGGAAEATGLLSRVLFHRGDAEGARREGARAVELAREAPPSLGTGLALAQRARAVVIMDRDSETALELAREAFTLADELGSPPLASHALNTIGMARVQLGDADGIADLERAVAVAEEAGDFTAAGAALNNLTSSLSAVGSLDDAGGALTRTRAFLERHGHTAGFIWSDGEKVEMADLVGNLADVFEWAERYFAHPGAETRYQARVVWVLRARSLLARGQIEQAVADAERALQRSRETGHDAQVTGPVLINGSRCLRAAGHVEAAEALLDEALGLLATVDVYSTWDLPLHMIELGRADEYLRLTEGLVGHRWLEAGRTAARGDLVVAAELYAGIGARFAEAWAALLAAERGDTARLDAALAYFEEQQATPYVQRCRALLQASA